MINRNLTLVANIIEKRKKNFSKKIEIEKSEKKYESFR